MLLIIYKMNSKEMLDNCKGYKVIKNIKGQKCVNYIYVYKFLTNQLYKIQFNIIYEVCMCLCVIANRMVQILYWRTIFRMKRS